jgi:hypothetical protein
MHKKLADKGLVVIVVSVDDVKKKEHVDAANVFLREENPPFIKLLLDAPHEQWSKKLDFTFPPFYYVFNRDGRWVRFPEDGDNDFYGKMDKAIIEMVNAK